MSATLRVGGGMAQISPDEMGFRLMVFNDDNPHAAAFGGLEYFTYDPSFVATAKFAPAAQWEKKVFQTSRGWYKAFFHIGDAVFTLKDRQITLPMYAGSDKLPEIDSLAAFIMDDTTGKETYGVGRYIDVALTPGIIPNEITLDFNYLYNPNCARSPHYNCPVAVDRLPIAILAGEKKPSAAH
ncbi:MAG: DUF1684 domain-containing protein [Alphaproteobacteria bacterium]|nr:DUF1684 domain-containing protein [Alphaproteobacteria bacterium]